VAVGSQTYPWQLGANQRELRLLFSWPLLPNGDVGMWKQNFRSTVAGQLIATNDFSGMRLYFYQPQSFSTAP